MEHATLQRTRAGLLAVRAGPMTPLLIDPSQLERYYGKAKPYQVRESGVAVIDISGPLAQDPSMWDQIVEGVTSYDAITSQVEDAATDPAVKGIVLRINSPGGETSGAFEAAGVIEAAAKIKPMCAVADSGAFSAAYMAAVAAGDVWVAPITGGVGSVGVIMSHIDYSGYLAKVGLNITTLYRGDRKNDFSPYKPLEDGAKDQANKILDSLYGEFVGFVAKHRKMTAGAVIDTQAGVFFGADAVSIGFADKVGSLRDAIAAMESRVGGNDSKSPSTEYSFSKGNRAMHQTDRHSQPASSAGTRFSFGEWAKKQVEAKIATRSEPQPTASMDGNFSSAAYVKKQQRKDSK